MLGAPELQVPCAMMEAKELTLDFVRSTRTDLALCWEPQNYRYLELWWKQKNWPWTLLEAPELTLHYVGSSKTDLALCWKHKNWPWTLLEAPELTWFYVGSTRTDQALFGSTTPYWPSWKQDKTWSWHHVERTISDLAPWKKYKNWSSTIKKGS